MIGRPTCLAILTYRQSQQKLPLTWSVEIREDVTLAVRAQMWCMSDGAPHILAILLWDVHNNTWIGREGLHHGLHTWQISIWIVACGNAIQLLLTTKRHFSIGFWLPVGLYATMLASLNSAVVCDETCLGVYWILWRDGLSTYILSPVTYELLIWTLFLVLAFAKSLSTPFRYILYTQLHIPGSCGLSLLVELKLVCKFC